MTRLCLKRDCFLFDKGPHIDHTYINIHDIEALIVTPESHPEINWKLEELKKIYGYRCIQCTRGLIPTDKDHAFCKDCWTANMEGVMS